MKPNKEDFKNIREYYHVAEKYYETKYCLAWYDNKKIKKFIYKMIKNYYTYKLEKTF